MNSDKLIRPSEKVIQALQPILDRQDLGLDILLLQEVTKFLIKIDTNYPEKCLEYIRTLTYFTEELSAVHTALGEYAP